MPFGYDCVICRQRYSSRTERNEHLEAHFIHKKCTDCDRLVILIGDLEFELHRPTHCTKFRQNNSIDNNDLKKLIAIERLKETVVDNDFSAGQNTLPLITDDNDDDTLNESLLKDDTDSGGDCRLSIVGDILPKEDTESLKQIIPSTRKRNRRKTAKKCENDSEEKKKDRIRKNRSAKLMECTQDGCTEQFRQQQLLRKHLKNVHGVVEKHLCSICNFSFSDKSNLKHHMVTHTDDKRFICSFCGARFHKLTNMTEHMNAHMGLKPYKCEICGKDFGRSNHKRQHMRVIIELTKNKIQKINVRFECHIN